MNATVVVMNGLGVKIAHDHGREVVIVGDRIELKVRPLLAQVLLAALYAQCEAYPHVRVLSAAAVAGISFVEPVASPVRATYVRDNGLSYHGERSCFHDYGSWEYDIEAGAVVFESDHFDLYAGRIESLTRDEVKLLARIAGVLELIVLVSPGSTWA